MTPLARIPFGDLLDQVAAKSPTPGGGAVASAVGALAAALAQMVLNYSVGKKSLAAHEPVLREHLAGLDRARALFLQLAAEDAAAYGLVNELARLPEGDARRLSELPDAVRASVQAPLATMAAGVETLRRFETLAAITNRHLRSDLAVAAILAEAAGRASRWNVLVNAPSLPTLPERDATQREADRLAADAARLCAAVELACEA